VRLRVVTIDEIGDVDAEVVVVIDVLRAFTTAPWCFERGASAMYLADTPTDAIRARHAEQPAALLLTDGPPARGFDLVNSPALIRDADLTGATVIQQTTNGTRGVYAALARPRALVLCSAFVTASATLRAIRRAQPGEVAFLVTGGDEDLALADYVIQVLRGGGIDASAQLRQVSDSHAATQLRDLAHRADYPGMHEDDLPLALEVDRFAWVPAAVRSGSLAQLHPLAS
jgi:2-phosphosulfolactate phosphatase